MILSRKIGIQYWALSALVLLASTSAFAAPGDGVAEAEASGAKIRYRQGQDISFDKLLIQGQLQKPSVSVVTGSVQQGGDGLLRIRKDFMDRITADYGEEVQ